MKILAFVITQDGYGIEGATILLTDKDGKVIPGSANTMADVTGEFKIDSPLIDKETTYMQISAGGYDTVRTPAKYVYGEIVLTPSEGSMLEEVVVTAKIKRKTPKKINYILPISLGAASLGILGYVAIKTWF
jgi:hypothetical protein